MKTLQEYIKAAAHDMVVGYRDSYSGRGMNGDTCIGIVGPVEDLNATVCEVIRIMANDMTDEVQAGSTLAKGTFCEYVNILLDEKVDSMGRDTIYYWPELQEIDGDATYLDRAEQSWGDVGS